MLTHSVVSISDGLACYLCCIVGLHGEPQWYSLTLVAQACSGVPMQQSACTKFSTLNTHPPAALHHLQAGTIACMCGWTALTGPDIMHSRCINVQLKSHGMQVACVHG
jgi:hypothetical protein